MIRYPNLRHLFDNTPLGYPGLRALTAEMVEARNVDNVPEVERYIEELIPEAGEKPEVKKWLESNLRNFLIRDYEEVEEIKILPADAPGWLEKALQEGKEVFHVVITPAFRDKIQHALDYLKSPDAPDKLDRVTVPEAIKQSETWTRRLTKKKVDRAAAEAGEVIIKDYDDGYSWRRLISKDALAREGTLMGHCSASYYDKVHAHQIEIWSLRDPKNEPHCTVELRVASQDVAQIKGKQNKEVIEKYRPYIRDILNDKLQGWQIAKTEIKNAGLFYYFNKWWTDKSQFAQDTELFNKLIADFFKGWNRFQSPPRPNPDGHGADIQFTLEDFLDYMDTVPRPARISTKTYRALLAYDPEIDQDPDSPSPPDSERARQALREGWRVGTQRAAREYAIKNLNRIRWEDGSITDPFTQEGVKLIISWAALENGHLGEITSGRNPKRGGWEATYDPEAAEKFLTGGA